MGAEVWKTLATTFLYTKLSTDFDIVASLEPVHGKRQSVCKLFILYLIDSSVLYNAMNIYDKNVCENASRCALTCKVCFGIVYC